MITFAPEEHKYLELLKQCFPILKITAPFGLKEKMLEVILSDKPNWIAPPQAITKPEYKHSLQTEGFDVLTWKKMHAKLAIGLNGAIWGSWNFNIDHEKKTTLRELIEFVSPEEKKYEQLNQQFDAWWEWQKHNVGGWND